MMALSGEAEAAAAAAVAAWKEGNSLDSTVSGKRGWMGQYFCSQREVQ
jgi:hypothetical protein